MTVANISATSASDETSARTVIASTPKPEISRAV
jgi:hypothetical protein